MLQIAVKQHLTLQLLSTGNCDFEHGGLCMWTNLRSGDQFDWLVGRGKTTTLYTGPNFDHTTMQGSGSC